MNLFLGKFIFYIYRFFLFPLALVFFRIFYFFLPQKIKLIFQDRKVFSLASISDCIWIHAASGEIEYVKPLIRKLKQDLPEEKILLTYFSPSAKNLFSQLVADAIVPIPFDSFWAVRHFLKMYRPKLGIISRTDLWPELCFQVHAKKIPLLLTAATLSEKKSAISSFIKPFFSFTYNCLTTIHCVSNEDKQHFLQMGYHSADSIVVTGDPRYDQAFYRKDHPKSLPDWLRLQKSPVVIFASTWPQDEKIIMQAIESLKTQEIKLIWVPHEFDKILPQYKNLDYQLWTDHQPWDKKILIVNQVGYLAELYQFADVAFIGGSFKSKVHSVMEALVYGIPVIVGPYYRNNREAIEFSNFILPTKKAAVTSVRNAIELTSAIQDCLQNPNKAILLNAVQIKCGATETSLNWVKKHIKK